MKLKVIALVISFLLTDLLFSTDPPKPKYGPEAIPISQSHDYFRKNPAPDYWALSPYYTAQFSERSCSTAAVTMLVNAARVGENLGSEEELVTEQKLIKRVKDQMWNKLLDPQSKGFLVILKDLKPLIEKSLAAYGIQGTTVEVIHIANTSNETRNRLHKILVENEKTARDFMIAVFIQGIYTGDAYVGHIAPVGAYDAKAKRVLILDPDRQWYEPYWVSEETFLKGMVTKDEQSGNEWRGYLWVKLKEGAR
ncbi:MAG: hypothetical protein HYT76_03400 [Deltaproteobacteria bacterium]|nr:hypothetical protein [Deltaproteobacteria bacterium]